MLKDFTQEKFDIIVQAGQSNSEGYGVGPTGHTYNPNDKVYFLNRDFTISMAAESVRGNEIVGNFAIHFATEYIRKKRLKRGRKLLIIRAAVGGTGFSDNRWGLSDDLYLNMMEMFRTALALNESNCLVAFLWHQGKTDAQKGCDYDTHYKNLLTLFTTVREIFHCPDLPIIAGDFTQHWKNLNLPICKPIIQAIKDVCIKIGNSSFVTTENIQSNSQIKAIKSDTIHFCRDGLYILGVRYYKAYAKITKRNALLFRRLKRNES